MKDVYMANLLSKNNDTEINLDDCPVVVRFRKALFYKKIKMFASSGWFRELKKCVALRGRPYIT